MTKGNLKLILPRIILGAIFVISGVNWFLGIDAPTSGGFSPRGEAFIEHLKAQGFLWPIIKMVEIIAGTFLLAGYLGPLAVLALAPLSLGIVAFHIILSPQHGAWLGYLVFALEIFLIVYWRKNLLHMIRHPRAGLSK